MNYFKFATLTVFGLAALFVSRLSQAATISWSPLGHDSGGTFGNIVTERVDVNLTSGSSVVYTIDFHCDKIGGGGPSVQHITVGMSGIGDHYYPKDPGSAVAFPYLSSGSYIPYAIGHGGDYVTGQSFDISTGAGTTITFP